MNAAVIAAITKNTNSSGLAAAIHEMSFDVWIGEEGYNTIPRLNGFPISGVAHSVGYADNRLSHFNANCSSCGPEFIQRQLDEAATTALSTGIKCLLTIREWHGCNPGDLHRWVTNGNGLWIYSCWDDEEE